MTANPVQHVTKTTDDLVEMSRNGDLEWADPNGRRPPGRRPSQFWTQIAELARSRPDTWLKVANRAQGTAQRIRSGTIGAFADGVWDATQVRVGVDETGTVRTDVYLKYCGPAADHREPADPRTVEL